MMYHQRAKKLFIEENSMIELPKVKKRADRSISGMTSIKRIVGSLVLAAGIAVGVGGAGDVEAAAPTSLSPAQGAIVFTPAAMPDDQVAYHRSHYSHQSHRSHYSHYSSRW